MSAVKRFSVDSFKSEFGNKYKIEFYCFFMTSNIWNILDMDKVCEIRANTPSLPCLNLLQAIDPSLVGTRI